MQNIRVTLVFSKVYDTSEAHVIKGLNRDYSYPSKDLWSTG